MSDSPAPAPQKPNSDPPAPAAPAAPGPAKAKSKRPNISPKKGKSDRSAQFALELQKSKKDRRRKGFLWGLLAGQVIILIVIFGGRAALFFLKDRVKFNPPIPLEALVFLGMVSGILVTAIAIFFVLGFLGAGYFFGGKKGVKKVGFTTAVGRGIRRCFSATWAIGVTLGVIGGTAWLLVPTEKREPTIDYLKDKGGEAIRSSKEWAENKFGIESVEEPAAEPASVPVSAPPTNVVAPKQSD